MIIPTPQGTVVPDAAEVGAAISELLKARETGSLAVISPDGFPAAPTMHFAADGLTLYMHVFTYTRTYFAVQRNPRVGYTVDHIPEGGLEALANQRVVQVTGVATAVTDTDEVEHAIALSREQFHWLADERIFSMFRNAGIERRNAFFRIDPREALWSDNRVHNGWRTLVAFTPDGHGVAALTPYPATATG
ncbi:pyridoxamine 5'-phosphate oxidase family protein [Streptomyces sp. NPDC058464]|uniref:pyridoxamine 5'-phosphate oxidase family protein n=1 Tax=Streptomyces sp. NPDC058464 TaxID=3346511 RepID=UPI00366555C2